TPSSPPSVQPATGSVVPGAGWVDVDYLGIDQGPIVGMIENHRSGLIWKVMRGSGYLRRGLLRAGLHRGWVCGAGFYGRASPEAGSRHERGGLRGRARDRAG